MSETVKLIIEIPDYEYRQIKEVYEKSDIVSSTYSYIYHGTPLDSNSEKAEVQAYFAGQTYGWEEGRKALIDDVKAEIGQGYCMANNDYDKGRNYGLYMTTQILDRIGKTESEEQNESQTVEKEI